MKRIVFTLALLLSILFTNGQDFFKTFNGVTDATQNKVFVMEDGFVLAGIGLMQDKYQLYVMKVNLNGDILWTKYHEIGYESLCYGSAMDPDGNLYISLQYSLVKLTNEGEIVYEYISEATLYDIFWHESGELIASGQWSPTQLFVFRIDPSDGKNIVQSTAIQGTNLIGTALSIDEDDNIVLSASDGFEYSAPVESNLYVFPNQDLQSYDVIPLQYNEAIVHRTTNWKDGSHLSIGHTEQYAIPDNVSYLTKFLNDGSVALETAVEFPYRIARLYKYVINNQNQVVALGEVKKNEESVKQIMLHCMGMDGDSIWTAVHGTSDITRPYDIKMAPDGGYVIAGTTDVDNIQIPCLIKTNALGQLTILGIEEVKNQPEVNVYPNPVNGAVMFETQEFVSGSVIITDVTGQKCIETTLTGTKTTVQTGALKTGLYLYTIQTNKFIKTGKILVE